MYLSFLMSRMTRCFLKMELAKVPADAVFFERLKSEVVAAISKEIDDYIADNNL